MTNQYRIHVDNDIQKRMESIFYRVRYRVKYFFGDSTKFGIVV